VFVRLRFRHIDPAAAGRITEALARTAVERSRQLRFEAGESPTADSPGLNAAQAALREAEQRVLDFRVQSRIELLAAEINAGLRRPGTLGTLRKGLDGVDPKVAGTLDELYRRELELTRLQTEYDIARQKYFDAARTASSLAVPEIHLVEKAVPAGQPVPTDRLRRFLLGLAIALLVAIGLAFAVEGLGPLASRSAVAR
jgi:uncharacterized protein involved in exopolysaccharide biosynthesis